MSNYVGNDINKSFTDVNKANMIAVSIKETERFVLECLKAVGVKHEHALQQAVLLAQADKRGHVSHGLNRLELYVNDIKTGMCDGNAVPKILKESDSCAWVDGNNSLGAVVGNFCMDLAIKKGKKTGIGFVAAKKSNHYGLASLYPIKALEECMIGMSGTNSSPCVCPTRAKENVMGTNPITFGAPAKDNDNFVLDMATSTVAVGKIEIAKRKGTKLLEGWALDADGKITTDPMKAVSNTPLGGDEAHSGYKGFGLSVMVEILGSILADANYSYKVRKWGTGNSEANLGHFFMALDPNVFAPCFQERLSDLLNYLRCLTPADKDKPVIVAGDVERIQEAISLECGVKYTQSQMETCERLSKELGVEMLKEICNDE